MIRIPEAVHLFIRDSGNGTDIPLDFEPVDSDFSVFPPEFGIQQNLAEFGAFIELCLSAKNNNIILEIGFGYHGSSHALLRHFFSRVISIDYQIDRMRHFFTRAPKYFGENFFREKKSFFVAGESGNIDTYLKVSQILNQQIEGPELLDVLFIDGSHKFHDVLTDFILYENLVKVSGFVAFHDTLNVMNENGVPRAIEFIKSCHLIDGRFEICHEFKETKNLGIIVLRKLG